MPTHIDHRDQSEKAAKRSCLVLSVLIFGVLPFSLLVLGLLLWYGREASGSRRLQARKSGLTKQGLPVDDSSLNQFYKSRTDPTHTEAWLSVLAIMSSPEFKSSLDGVAILFVSSEEPIVPEKEWKEEKVSLAFLEKWKSLHAEIVQLSIDAKAVRFPIVFDSFATMLPQVQESRHVARFLELQGRVGLRSGDSAVVREGIDAMLGLSRVPSGDPIMVSQLVSIAIDGIAIGLLKDAIKYDVLNESDLQTLLPKVQLMLDVGEDWKAALAGERAMALPIFTDPTKARAAGILSIPGRSHDALLYLELIDVITDEVQPWDLQEFKAKLVEFDDRIKEIANAGLLSKFDSILTLQSAPALGAFGDAFLRRALQHRIATIAIGLRLYEDRHATLPSSTDLLSDIPLDLKRLAPTKSNSFGYRLDGYDAKLWGGTFSDVLKISAEPHRPETEGEEAQSKSNREIWLWEIPSGKKRRK